ncbi:MAG: hypothetical protein Q9214_005413 [Letrouitia sp. 1 TL-2023]
MRLQILPHLFLLTTNLAVSSSSTSSLSEETLQPIVLVLETSTPRPPRPYLELRHLDLRAPPAAAAPAAAAPAAGQAAPAGQGTAASAAAAPAKGAAQETDLNLIRPPILHLQLQRHLQAFTEYSPQLPVLQQVDFLCSPSVGGKPLTLPPAAANGAPAAPAAPAGKFCNSNLFSDTVNYLHAFHFSTRSWRRYNWRTWQRPTRDRQPRGCDDSAGAEARTDWHGDAHRGSWGRENLGGEERSTKPKPKPKPQQKNRVERALVGDGSARGNGLRRSGGCAFVGEKWAFASF